MICSNSVQRNKTKTKDNISVQKKIPKRSRSVLLIKDAAADAQTYLLTKYASKNIFVFALLRLIKCNVKRFSHIKSTFNLPKMPIDGVFVKSTLIHHDCTLVSDRKKNDARVSRSGQVKLSYVLHILQDFF